VEKAGGVLTDFYKAPLPFVFDGAGFRSRREIFVNVKTGQNILVRNPVLYFYGLILKICVQ